MIKFQQHIPITTTELSVIEQLVQACREFNLSKATIKDALNKGAVWLTHGKSTKRIRKAKKTLAIGNTLHFYYDESVLGQAPEPAQLIADQQDYSIWYKPYGMLSQGSKWSDHCTIARWVETNIAPQRPAFIVHRLDRAASGLIIIAHRKKTAQAFSEMFEKRLLEKHYHIIVHGQMLTEFDELKGQKINKNVDGKLAKSTFYPQEVNPEKNLSLIKVSIDTGRKHQIRKHAAAIGLPVVGDRFHGDKGVKYHDDINLQLCAVELSFICPSSHEPLIFQLPSQLKLSLTALSNKLD